MIETLTTSGALWELHAWKDEFAIGARWKALRLKQLRRAIRRQRWVIFKLRVRSLFPRRLTTAEFLAKFPPPPAPPRPWPRS